MQTRDAPHDGGRLRELAVEHEANASAPHRAAIAKHARELLPLFDQAATAPKIEPWQRARQSLREGAPAAPPLLCVAVRR